MTAEDIMHALRLTAMGRVNTPEQQRLCEALAELLETSEQRASREMAVQAQAISDQIESGLIPSDEEVMRELDQMSTKPKRTRKKAD